MRLVAGFSNHLNADSSREHRPIFSSGLLTLEQRAAALSTFNRLAAESFAVLPVTGAHFRAAAKFVDQHTLGLRAGDALHLATASEHGATVHTLDRRLSEAGRVLGVPTQLST
jgi:predicted nucleic acid-binding protein